MNMTYCMFENTEEALKQLEATMEALITGNGDKHLPLGEDEKYAAAKIIERTLHWAELLKEQTGTDFDDDFNRPARVQEFVNCQNEMIKERMDEDDSQD